jgi:hypothetical protein
VEKSKKNNLSPTVGNYFSFLGKYFQNLGVPSRLNFSIKISHLDSKVGKSISKFPILRDVKDLNCRVLLRDFSWDVIAFLLQSSHAHTKM